MIARYLSNGMRPQVGSSFGSSRVYPSMFSALLTRSLFRSTCSLSMQRSKPPVQAKQAVALPWSPLRFDT